MRNWLRLLVLVWVMKDFATMRGLIAFLNTLPEQRQLEAKIVTDDAVGVGGYSLFYREDRL